MARPKLITQEMKEKVRDLYLEGFKYEEIHDLVGVARGSINRIIEQYGLPHRNAASAMRSVKEGRKRCPKCGKVNTNAMTECCYCGSDIRSRAQRLIPKCETLMSYAEHLPSELVDNALEIMREIREYLKEQ